MQANRRIYAYFASVLLLPVVTACAGTPAAGSGPTAAPNPVVTSPVAGGASASPTAEGGATYKVGMVVPLTGPVGTVGAGYEHGAKAAEDVINANGGIANRPVEVIECDSRSDTAQAVACTRQLIDEQKVIVLLGGVGTAEVQAVAPIAANAGVTDFASAGSTTLIHPTQKWLFRAVAGNDDQIPVATAYLNKKGLTNIALLLDNGAFGQDSSATIKEALGKNGLTVVDEETYAPADTDMTAQLTRIREKNPQALFNWAPTAQAAAVITKNAQQLGMKNVVQIGGLNLDNPGFAQLAGPAVAPMVVVGSKLALAQVPADDPLKPTIDAFTQAYVKRYQTRPNATDAAAFDAFLIIQDAARRAGAQAQDRSFMRDRIEETKDLKGVEGLWTLGPDKHYGDLGGGLLMVSYQTGEWVLAQ